MTFTPQPSDNPSPTRISALEITSDASSALDFISLLGDATPSALALSPLSLGFGAVQLGATTTLPIQITNTSPTAATFNSITTTGDYAVTGNCPAANNTLAANTSCTEQIAFTPTQTGPRTGTLAIATSLSTLPINAPLTGTGTQSQLTVTPTTLNFGSIALGASAALTLTLANTGTATITSLTLNPTGDYAVTTPCATNTLLPNATCQITLTFAPSALGARDGTLTITSSTTPATIPLTGTGVTNGNFLLTVNGGPTASATVVSEHPATYNLQLTPQNNYAGTVILNCTPINPGRYVTCSLLPSSITLTGTAQSSVATINTITTINPTSATSRNTQPRTLNRTLLCLLPASALFFWTTRRRKNPHPLRTTLWTLLLTLITLSATSCGSGGDPNIRTTPPGTYQYQVTASSTTGVQLTQTVTLNLTVTAH
ncbi:MAG: choice-of-anchor D domain-containing protein [Edaphobacter sp.]